jgi:putative endonuclease
MRTKTEKGKWGEMVAAQFLQKLGYRIQSQNLRTPYGEIDLVALETTQDAHGCDEEILVFVEVKMRTSDKFGYPEDSIDSRKRHHLLASIQSYLQDHPEIALDWRVDVIAIQQDIHSNSTHIQHFIDAITNLETT